jgi:predicted nucleotidyltransferase
MNKILEHNENSLRTLCIEHNVKSLFAFGSVTGSTFTEDSDIDLVVSFMPMSHEDYADNYFELIEKLEELFQRPVDLVTEKSLKNPYFIASVNRTKCFVVLLNERLRS